MMALVDDLQFLIVVALFFGGFLTGLSISFIKRYRRDSSEAHRLIMERLTINELELDKQPKALQQWRYKVELYGRGTSSIEDESSRVVRLVVNNESEP